MGLYAKVEPKRPIVFAKVVNKCNGDFNASLDLIEKLRGRKNQQQQQQQRKVRVHIRKMVNRRPLLQQQQQRQPQHDIRQKCMDVELFDQLIQFYPNRPVVLMRLINRLDTQDEQVRLALNQFMNNTKRLNLGKLGKFVKNHPRPRNQQNQCEQRLKLARESCFDKTYFDKLIVLAPNRPRVVAKVINKIDTTDVNVQSKLDRLSQQQKRPRNIKTIRKFIRSHPRNHNNNNNNKLY